LCYLANRFVYKEKAARHIRFRKHKRHDLDDDIRKRIPSRGYQELFQAHLCRMVFVDIADTKPKNIKPTNKNPGVPSARQAKTRVLMIYLGPSHICIK
jgi:hypothetical protein